MYIKDNNSVSNTKDAYNTGKNKVQDKAEDFSSKATHLKDKAVDAVKNSYDTAKDKVKDTYGTAKDKARDAYDTIKDTAIYAEEDVIEYVKSNPVKSLGVAFLAGLLVSYLKNRE
jgi:ElaB/YqjD/DUF883 family membrane-anchored ribosome-binding protein